MESLNSRVEGEHEKRGIVQGGERQRKKGYTEQQRENGGVSWKCGEEGASTSREMWEE